NLAPTTAPVICVPGGVHLMNLELSTVRVALYAANVGKNIHLLRVPTMKHVFIGHGDSDKLASVNPYSKVYDQVWPPGPAGPAPRRRGARPGRGAGRRGPRGGGAGRGGGGRARGPGRPGRRGPPPPRVAPPPGGGRGGHPGNPPDLSRRGKHRGKAGAARPAG